MLKSSRWFLGFCFVLLSLRPALATNGMEMTFVGARSGGMGGADLAVATDATAINTNPAGLTQTKNHRIDAGAALMIPTLHFQNAVNDKDGALQIFPMPVLAYAHSLEKVPISFGMGMFAQGGMGAKFSMEHPVIHPGEKLDYRSQIAYMKLSPALAYQPHKMISIGVSFNVGFAMMAMKMPYSVQPSLMEGEASMTMAGGNVGKTSYGALFGGMLGYDELTAIAELKDAIAYGFGGKFGVLLTPHEKVSIGLTYTMKSKLTFHGKARMDMQGQFDDAMPKMVDAFAAMPTNIGASQEEIQQGIEDFFASNGIDPSIGYSANYDAKIAFAWPRKVGLGLAVKPIDNLLIAVDIHWIHWSDSMKKFKMVMTDGDNENINRMIGSDKVVTILPLNWKDQFPIAVGVEYEFLEGVFGRMGYSYGENPVPSSTVFPVFPAIVEHHITLGGGYNYADFFEINVAYELAVPNTQKGASDHAVASEYDNSKSTLGEHTVSLLGSFTW